MERPALMAVAATRQPSLSTPMTPDQISQLARNLPGGAAEIEDVYPLSPLQEGMLFHCLMNDRDSYVLSTLLQLESREQVGSLIQALTKVMNRHSALRSAIVWEGLTQPMQVVYRQALPQVEELRVGAARNGLEQLRQYARRQSHRMDLGKPPLVRLLVADAGSPECHALLQVHHLICDHQSLRSLIAEVLACLEGREAALVEPAGYREYVMQALTDAQAGAEHFFRGKLSDVEETTAPFGLLDVHGDGSLIEEARVQTDPTSSQLWRSQANKAGVSAARLFHAAWALVLAHTSGLDDVVFATVLLTGEHARPGTQRVLGLSVNTLPLRLRLQSLTVIDLLDHTHRELLELRRYRHAPLALAQRCSGVSGAAPLFTSLLNYRHSVSSAAEESATRAGVRVLERGEAWTNYPITVIVDDLGEAFALTAQTDRSIDPERVLSYLQTAVQSLVDALENSPSIPALSLHILPQRERRQLLEEFNPVQQYPQEKLLQELFEGQVRLHPNAIAVTCEGQSLTYAALNARANQLAWHLREMGVGTDQLVGICMERSLEMVVGLIGILKAGGAYVPSAVTINR